MSSCLQTTKQKTIKLLKHPKTCTVSSNCKIWDLKSYFTAEHQRFICLGLSHKPLQHLVQQCRIGAASTLSPTALRAVSSPRKGTAGKTTCQLLNATIPSLPQEFKSTIITIQIFTLFTWAEVFIRKLDGQLQWHPKLL